LLGDGFESHCVASQAVWLLGKLRLKTREKPANGGILRSIGHSPGSKFGALRVQIAESLRTDIQIFPFLGDRRWRPGSISLHGRSGSVCCVAQQRVSRPSEQGTSRLCCNNGRILKKFYDIRSTNERNNVCNFRSYDLAARLVECHAAAHRDGLTGHIGIVEQHPNGLCDFLGFA
jgi:hypothetical protein